MAKLNRIRERMRADPDWESRPKPIVAEVREKLQALAAQSGRRAYSTVVLEPTDNVNCQAVACAGPVTPYAAI